MTSFYRERIPAYLAERADPKEDIITKLCIYREQGKLKPELVTMICNQRKKVTKKMLEEAIAAAEEEII